MERRAPQSKPAAERSAVRTRLAARRTCNIWRIESLVNLLSASAGFFFLFLFLRLRLANKLIKAPRPPRFNANVAVFVLERGLGVARFQTVIPGKSSGAVNLVDIHLGLPTAQQQGNNFIKPHLLDNWSFKWLQAVEGRPSNRQRAGK